MARAAFVLPAALVLALAGCGQSGEPSVRETVKKFYGAVANGDGKAACRFLTPRARRQAAFRSEGEELGSSCVKNLSNERVGVPSTITPAVIDDDSATATVEGVEQGQPRTLSLIKQDGEWRISEF